MIAQNTIWTLALLGIGLISVVFIYVVANASKPPADQGGTTANRLQAAWFAVLLVGFVAGSWATLRHYPIPAQEGSLGAEQVVEVTGHMWRWEIAPATIRVGSSVEFRVTSADVNHGFGVYAPDGHMVAQTQAMPEYVNRLLYTFDEPGIYTVHCLEYCGVGHAPMKASFEVVAATQGD